MGIVDWKALGFTALFALAVVAIALAASIFPIHIEDRGCHTAYVISDYRIFNGTNTADLYDIADHFAAFNGTTVAHISQQGWYIVKIAPTSIGSVYPLLGLKFESLRVCK